MKNKILPKTALLSVSDKSGLVSFGRFLKKKSVKIVLKTKSLKNLSANKTLLKCLKNN